MGFRDHSESVAVLIKCLRVRLSASAREEMARSEQSGIAITISDLAARRSNKIVLYYYATGNIRVVVDIHTQRSALSYLFSGDVLTLKSVRESRLESRRFNADFDL